MIAAVFSNVQLLEQHPALRSISNSTLLVDGNLSNSTVIYLVDKLPLFDGAFGGKSLGKLVEHDLMECGGGWWILVELFHDLLLSWKLLHVMSTNVNC